MGRLGSFSGGRGGLENARALRLRMHFFNSNYILVRNLDAHVFFFSALGEAVFEENGFAGVRSQHADRGNMNVARAIMSFDTFTHERGVSGHRTPG